MLQSVHKKMLLIFACFLLTVGAIWAEQATLAHPPKGWMTSFEGAVQKAQKEDKLVMAFFTGSDWCGVCHIMTKEILDTKSFMDWAADNLVLLYLDYPKLSKLPEPLATQNAQLQKKYGIDGYPTVIFFNSAGEAITSIGYVPGGAENWLKLARLTLPKRTEFSGDLATSYAMSREKNLPLLVVAGVGDFSSRANRQIQQFLLQPGVRLNSSDNMLVCKLDLATASKDDMGLWRHLSSKSGLGKKYPALLLLSPEQQVLYAQQGTDFPPSQAAATVSAKLPRANYSGQWLNDYALAQRVARATGRNILLMFTGSDWCEPCKMLEAKILSTGDFKAFAAQNLVLAKLDYPKTKILPQEQQLQNQVLASAFGIDAFPLLVVVKPDGVPSGALMYTMQSTKEMINELKQFMQAR